MNIRKAVDYTEMYSGLDVLLAADLSQMELYRGIGEVVNRRQEKGAAVAAAEYLQGKYPDSSGFSPRNLRRMREFYRTYENSPALMDEAMKIGWTQNVVIMESGLSLEEMSWYIKAVCIFGWSKLELAEKIAERAHETVCLEKIDYTEEPVLKEVAYTNSKTKPTQIKSALTQRTMSLLFLIKRAIYSAAVRIMHRRQCILSGTHPKFAQIKYKNYLYLNVTIDLPPKLC